MLFEAPESPVSKIFPKSAVSGNKNSKMPPNY